MARPARLSVGGELHYVVQIGHNRQPVFVDDVDRSAYLAMLGDAARSIGVAVHAHALLDNEVHLLLTPAAAGDLGALMQSLGRRYVAAFNRRHGRVGSLWAGRFRCAVIDGEGLGIDAIVQVETRPVAAGLAGAAADWAWSSARHHLGRRRDPAISEHPGYWRLGNTPFERELAHARRLDHGISEKLQQQFSQAASQGRPVGPPAFLRRIGSVTGRSLARRPRGRPRSAQLDAERVPN